MKDTVKVAWVVLSFVVLAALCFHDVLSGEYLLIERDLGEFFIPPRLFWVEAVKQGSFPFWNPYYHGGHPLFATLQPGVFYPFSLPYFFLPFAIVFNNTIVLHFALAGIFTYLLMRAQNASHSASFIAGICFVFGGYLMSVHSLLSTLLSVTWMPLFLLVYFSAFIRIKKNHARDIKTLGNEMHEPPPDRELSRNNITRSISAGIVGTIMFLGGGVEVCLLIFPLVFLISIWPNLLFEKQHYPQLKIRLLCFAMFTLTFAGLAAVQLLPFMELSQLSIRSQGISYQEATKWSLHPADLITFFISDLYGYMGGDLEKYWGNQSWLKSIYLGSIPFLLSLIFIRKRGRKAQGFTLLALLSLVLAFGKYSLFYPFIYKYLPFFDQVRYPVKFIFLTIFLISLSAGFGYDRFKEGLETDPQKTQGLASGILGLGFSAMIVFGIFNAYEEPILDFCRRAGWDRPVYNDLYINMFNFKRFLGFTGVFTLILFLWANARIGKKFYAYAVVLVLTLDLFYSAFGFYQKEKTETYMLTGSNMQFVLSDPSLHRVLTTRTKLNEEKNSDYKIIHVKNPDLNLVAREKILPGLGLTKKIFGTNLAEVTIQLRYKRILDLILTSPQPDSTNLLNMLNIKYITSIPALTSPNLKLVQANVSHTGPISEIEYTDAIKVYENLKTLPRAFLVANCREALSDNEYKNIFSDKTFYPDQVVLLDKSPDGFPCGVQHIDPANGNESVNITDYGNNSISLRVYAHSKKFLFMSESHYPGWEAIVDGKPIPILRANYAFRAVLLEPGEHQVQFVYNSGIFKLGAAISLLTIIICVWISTRSKRRRRLKTI